MAGVRISEGVLVTEADQQAHKALVDDFLSRLSPDQRAEMALHQRVVTVSTAMPPQRPALQNAGSPGTPVAIGTAPCRRCKKPTLTARAFLELCEQAGFVVDWGAGAVRASLGGFTVVGSVPDVEANLHQRRAMQQQSLESLEDQKGFRCVRCGAIYCMRCLFRYAPSHHKGGKACPNCGGMFEALDQGDEGVPSISATPVPAEARPALDGSDSVSTATRADDIELTLALTAMIEHVRVMIERVRRSERPALNIALEYLTPWLLFLCPLAAWLGLQFGFGFRWWTALLLGGLGGFVAVFVLIDLIRVVERDGGWEKRLLAAVEAAFRRRFPDRNETRNAALRALSELSISPSLSMPDPEAFVWDTLTSLQYVQYGGETESSPANARADLLTARTDAAVENMRALVQEMAAFTRQQLDILRSAWPESDDVGPPDRGGFRLGLVCDAPEFEMGLVPLCSDEEVIFTMDNSSESAAQDTLAAIVATDRRIILCRDWRARPFQWTDIPYCYVETVRIRKSSLQSRVGLVIFDLEDGDIRFVPSDAPDLWGGFFAQLVKLSGAPQYRRSAATPDFETAKREWAEWTRRWAERMNESQGKQIVESHNRGITDACGKTFLEVQNRGTTHDTWEVANAYWLAHMFSDIGAWVLYEFVDGKAAREALLEVDCIHEAADTGNLICTEVLVFGVYQRNDRKYEAVLLGKGLSHERWAAARESFLRHGGRCKSEREPEQTQAAPAPTKAAWPESVVFLEEQRRQMLGQTMIYRVHRAPDAESAKAFLERNPVTEEHLYLVVETPEGSFCRDRLGIYEE